MCRSSSTDMPPTTTMLAASALADRARYIFADNSVMTSSASYTTKAPTVLAIHAAIAADVAVRALAHTLGIRRRQHVIVVEGNVATALAAAHCTDGLERARQCVRALLAAELIAEGCPVPVDVAFAPSARIALPFRCHAVDTVCATTFIGGDGRRHTLTPSARTALTTALLGAELADDYLLAMILVPSLTRGVHGHQRGIATVTALQHLYWTRAMAAVVANEQSTCAVCLTASASLDVCARCGAVRYCSRDCQVRDWTIHRDHCARNAE
jgi:hypothetical protein